MCLCMCLLEKDRPTEWIRVCEKETNRLEWRNRGRKIGGQGKKASGGIRLFILLIESPHEAGNERDKGEGRAMKSK